MAKRPTPPTIEEFWQRVLHSGLLSDDRCRRFREAYTRVQGASRGNGALLGQWLVAQGVLTRYQAKALLLGRGNRLTVEDYVIEDRVRTGRLAGRYRARHLPTGHRVLLDIRTKMSAAQQAELAQRCKAAASLVHPHIQRTFAFAATHQGAVVAFEFVTGRSLAARIDQDGTLAPQEACRVAYEIALALAPLQHQRSLYGYLEPKNVWITRSGHVKLLSELLVGSQPVGTEPARDEFAGLAPERRRGDLGDARSDLYSLGWILYKMLTGQPPSSDIKQESRRRKAAAFEARTSDFRQRDIPAPIVELTEYLLANDPFERYQTAEAAAEALAPYAGSPRTRLPDPPTPTLAAYELWLADHLPSDVTDSTFAENTDLQAAEPTKPGSLRLATASDDSTADHLTAQAMSKPDSAGTTAAEPTMAAPFLIDMDADSLSAKRRRRRRAPLGRLVWFASFVVTALLVVLLVRHQFEAERTASHSAGSGGPPPAADSGQADSPIVTQQGRDDFDIAGPTNREPGEQRTWQSPTSGKPLNLAYLPSGMQLIVCCRPAELLELAEGAKTAAAMAPWIDPWRDRIRAMAGTPLENIAELQLGFLKTPDEKLSLALAAVTREPVERSELLEAWGQPTQRAQNGHTFFDGSETSYWLPPTSETQPAQRIVVAPKAELDELAVRAGEPPGLRRDFESLLQHSDRQRQVTVIFSPAFLLTDAQALFPEERAALLKTLDNFFRDDASAVMVSAHLDANLFVETRLIHHADAKGQDLAKTFRTRADEIPRTARDWLTAHAVSDYSRAVLSRFPEMLELGARYTRTALDDRDVLLRVYLPSIAAHNLALATRLYLLEKSAVGSGEAAPSAPRMTVEERLTKPVTLRFPRQTLETAIELLGEEAGVPIEILGRDLQIEGITKNQSFGLDEAEKPAAEILRKILARASPDGKLVYTIKPHPKSGHETIFITTRKAAESRGDPLPPALQSKK